MDVIAVVSGVLFGILTGLIPGIHVNTVTALLLISSASLASLGIDYSTLLFFTCSLAISHTFFDVIPGLFLGVPGDESYALLPGHRLVKKGEGLLAIRLSVFGSSLGLFIGIVVIAFLVGYQYLTGVNLISDTDSFLSSWMFWVLTGFSLILILSDHNIFWSTIVFLFSGSLGFAVFASPLIPGGSEAPVNALFPSLAGLFGVAGIVYAITTSSHDDSSIDVGKSVTLSKSHVANSSIRGGVAGFIVGLLPGLGAANAATLLLLIEQKLGKKQDQDTEDKSYLVTTSSLNTSEALFSIAALYLIEKSRSGASIAIDQILGGHIGKLDLIQISIAMLGSGVLSALIMWLSGRKLSIQISCMNHIGLNWSVIIFLISLTCFLLGFGGLAILVCASVVGLLPLVSGVRRAQLMGFFLVPTILFYSGYEADIVELLSIEARLSPSISSISISDIAWSIGISILMSLMTYQMVCKSGEILYGSKPIAAFCSILLAFTITVTTIGWAYPKNILKPIPIDQQFKYPELLKGTVTKVIDGDTIDIGSSGRRFRVRLAGIDAPELSQPYGDIAKEWLNNRLINSEILWKPVGVGFFGRILAIIYIDDVTLNQEMVRLGHAWVFPNAKNLSKELKNSENIAQEEGIGLWADSLAEAPWAWRQK